MIYIGLLDLFIYLCITAILAVIMASFLGKKLLWWYDEGRFVSDYQKQFEKTKKEIEVK